MSIRARLALAFAGVAIATAGVIVLAVPTVVGRGFARLLGDAGPGGPGPGAGSGAGPMAGIRAQQVQDETILTLVVVALAAAAVASVIGALIASRIVKPLTDLEGAAAAVSRGELSRRSGLAHRGDELGSLGRSFDAMGEALAAAETSRRRFLQDAAHELKTPLAVIDATTTAVLDGVYAHDDRHLETIRQQSRLLARIVDDLRTISLAEAGDLPLRLETVRIGDLVATAAGAFAARAEAAGVTIVQSTDGGTAIRADGDRIRQVLGALLDNALRHTPPGGSITIEASRGRTGTRVTVADTGPGMPAADLPHVFDRFYQADAARDRGTGTSGLGLAILRAIIEAHQGRVGAENGAGGGARVWFELPA